jgi:hypothetical protein
MTLTNNDNEKCMLSDSCHPDDGAILSWHIDSARATRLNILEYVILDNEISFWNKWQCYMVKCSWQLWTFYELGLPYLHERKSVETV